ncbi:CocE/NonD family hydrolase [Polymorphobacter sp. PAMC 29334]|uniref:CocE/NonD family hydrolase n=1 Tax=Polymorphobacter sp. PAMC 29334 TaxID=2862331 RepID=UPI001C781DC9|nr:CocE/NonD family hydrolase [Polymorphobacter sp. PAMC 29334]QYE34474.1 CocE/NonD family hydrolase [Polymorphobacter sp. PAMC 29334]
MVGKLLGGIAGLALLASVATAQSYTERPVAPTMVNEGANYVRLSVDIPMRDGITLHTVILTPKGAANAPILLTRTPYGAETGTMNTKAGDLATALEGYDNAYDVIAEGGYIRVVQDIRGKYGSKGDYVMNRPLVGSSLNPTKIDDSTDCYDTIDWLVKNLKQSNGKVGIMGISYDGYEPLVALINPHPALKVSVPMNPMVDGWRGDDWFHNGAFRQMNMEYIWEQVATTDNSSPWFHNFADQYDEFLDAGSAGELGRRHGLDQIATWQKFTQHPAYDAFWQEQAMDRILAKVPLKVPVMLVNSLWDQEDIYGATAVYRALKPKDAGNDMVFLSMGPWYHGQEIEKASKLGNVEWDQDTGKWWRHHVLAPFLAHFLKGTLMDVAPVTVFQSGTNQWQRLQHWPAALATTPLYLKPRGGLGFTRADGPVATEEYVSDPAHPVSFVSRPVAPIGYEGDHWTAWLTSDQRNAASRPDVLTFTSAVLSAPVTIAGAPEVHLNAETSGTDSDWVVKLIDVYPDQVGGDQKMGGYELAVSMDIFRGRYREGLDKPKVIAADHALSYTFDLPSANHVFAEGHRIMVQVQSSWFPLYDRNPQKFVPNIFFAKPGDYQKAIQRITVAGPNESFIALPVAE